MRRVAAYCRVSTDKSDQSNSFENQKSFFQAWIAGHPDWELVGIFADEGLSGTSTQKRLRFLEMIRMAKAGEVDLILTKEVSRFARNTVDTLRYTRTLRALGVGVIFLLDNINTLDADGELRLTIMATLAQEESRKISQRVKWGQTRRMEQGVVFGSSLLGYDVRGGQLTVNPEGAEIVRSIFRKCLLEGKGSGRIARELQATQIPSSRGVCRWSASGVLKILRNEKYCGDLIQKKSYTPDYLTHQKQRNTGQEALVCLRNHHPAIIDRPFWEAVQTELDRRRRVSGPAGGCGSRHPLSGKIICGVCGSFFRARWRQKGNGARYLVWRCGNSSACGIGRQLRDKDAGLCLTQILDAMGLFDLKDLAQCIEATMEWERRQEQQDAAAIDQQIQVLRKKHQVALEGFLMGRITQTEFALLREAYEQDNRRLQNAPVRLTKTPEPPEDWLRILEQFLAESDPAALFAPLLERMTLEPDGSVLVELKRLPGIFTVSPDAVQPVLWTPPVPDASSVPMSVNNPLSSG